MWALIGSLFVLAVMANMTKSWMAVAAAAAAAAAGGGGERSRLRLCDSRRKLKSVSITGTYITLCVRVDECVCVYVCDVLKMYPTDDV